MLAKAIWRDQLRVTPAPANVFLDEYGGGEIFLDTFRRDRAIGCVALGAIC
jgi:hypothetical protein